MRRGQSKKVLPVGKLPLEHLRSLLRHLPKHDPRLLIGPQIGEDAAVIDAGDRYLVVTTDPISSARTQTSSARRINLAYLDCAFATVAKHQPTADYQTLAWFARERFLPMHSPHWAPATRELNTGNVEHPHLACSWASAPF